MMKRFRAGSLGCLVTLLACGPGSLGPPVEINVPEGATFASVRDTLVERGLVDWGWGFGIYARAKGSDREIRSGKYALSPGTSWGELLAELTAGRVLTEVMVIPEGLTLRQMAPRIGEITELPESAVYDSLTLPTASGRFGVPGPGLEGFLFPDTYRFAQGVALDRVVGAMVDRYHQFWTGARRQRLMDLGLQEGELVTLASIIQAEARRFAEMPLISSVYHNRLRLGMLLQADPTVLYALGGPRPRLLFAAMDSVADHPYNTYTHPGLPPGPIGAPGERALLAALDPPDTDLLYFVARPTGEHLFSRTLAEHNRAVAQARRERDGFQASDSSGRRP